MTEVSPADSLGELVRYMASNLVEDGAEIEVHAEQRGAIVQIELRVPASELGKVIGREGRIARSMRTLVGIASMRFNLRANLDIDGRADAATGAAATADA